MKYTHVVIGIALAALMGVIVVWGLSDGGDADTSPLPDTMTLYWGDGCSHCENVKKFLEEKHIAESVSFEQKEVWGDRANANEMNRRAKACGLSTESIGVPFLFSDGSCFVGAPEVEKEFTRKAELSSNTDKADDPALMKSE